MPHDRPLEPGCPPVAGSAPRARVLLGIGANVGRPVQQLARALHRLGGVLRVEDVSSVYRSEPVGAPDAQPDYFNAVVCGSTACPPVPLLRALHAVEAELGRVRTVRNAPRPLDLDLLAYETQVLSSGELTLPHPRMHERAFVLVPLQEVAPAWRHPVLGLTPAELMERAGPLERVERWGALPGWGNGVREADTGAED